jgi:hypothetical protein
VAYLSGDLEAADKALGTAHRKWKALQVRDAGVAAIPGQETEEVVKHIMHIHDCVG